MQPYQHKYSVVIPLYNKQDCIARAIHSVLQQDLQDFEIVVVDDGSLDESALRVAEIRDPRIRLVSQPNSGASAARNTGIRLARNPYIAFLDADDQWLPEFLSLITGLVCRFPAAGAYATNYLIQNPGRDIQPATVKYVPAEPGGGLIESYFRSTAFGNTPITSSTVCIQRAVFEKVGFFPEGVALYEDLDMWSRIASEFPVAYSNQPGGIYQRNAENRACNRIVPDRTDLPFAEMLRGKIRRGEFTADEVDNVTEFINRYALQNAYKAVVAGESREARLILAEVHPQSIGRFSRKMFIYVLSTLPGRVVSLLARLGRKLKLMVR